MIFAVFNGIALIHMFLAAPETKGKTLEEMDEVFESGKWAWQGVPKESRLEALSKDIEKGAIKVIPGQKDNLDGHVHEDMATKH